MLSLVIFLLGQTSSSLTNRGTLLVSHQTSNYNLLPSTDDIYADKTTNDEWYNTGR
jgi:hypothetical protein